MLGRSSRKFVTCLMTLALALSTAAGYVPAWADDTTTEEETAVTTETADAGTTDAGTTDDGATDTTPTETPAVDPTETPTPAVAPSESSAASPTTTPENGNGTSSSTPSTSSTTSTTSSATSFASSQAPDVITQTYQLPPDQQPALAAASSLPDGAQSLSGLFGKLWDYGIVADEIQFGGTVDAPVQTGTNFAANKVSGYVNLSNSPAANDTPLMYRTAEIEGTVTADPDQSANFYLTAADSDKLKTGEDTPKTKVVEQTKDVINSRIESGKTAVQTISAKLSGQNDGQIAVALTPVGADGTGPQTRTITTTINPATGTTTVVDPATGDTAATTDAAATTTTDAAAGTATVPAATDGNLVVDTTADAFPDNAVFYFTVDSSAVADKIAQGKLEIRKKGSQKLVFTYTEGAGTDVTIGSYSITVNGTQGISSDTSNTDFLRDSVTDAVVWNLRNATKVTLNGTAGIVLVPIATANITLGASISSGMILTPGTVTAGTSFQFMNQQRTNPSEGQDSVTVRLGMVKRLSWTKGAAPSSDQTFRFTLKKTGDGLAPVVMKDEQGNAVQDGISQDTSISMTASDLAEKDAKWDKSQNPFFDMNAAFTAFAFDQEGNYTCEIAEADDKAEGITYDTKTITVRIDVTRGSDGKLSAAVVLPNDPDNNGQETTLQSEAASGMPEFYSVGTFENTYAEKPVNPVSYQIGVSTQLSWTKGMPPVRDVTFTAELKGPNLASDSTNADASFTVGEVNEQVSKNANESQLLKRAAGANFGKVTFRKEGTYEYTLTEKNGEKKGFTYDTDPMTIQVTVSKNKAGDALEISGVKVLRDGKDITSDASRVKKANDSLTLTFQNSYRPLPVMYSIPVNKVVNGTDSKDTFTFRLYQGQNGNKEVARGLVDGRGTVNLKPTSSVHYSEKLAEKYDKNTPHFFFTSPCDEWYRLEEDTGNLTPEYVASDTVWYLHVTVKDYGGQLQSTAVVTNKNGSKSRQIGVWYKASESNGQKVPDTRKMYIRATVTNTYATGNFAFYKVSSENTNLGLSGAVFTLYRIPLANGVQSDRSSQAYQTALARLQGGQVFENGDDRKVSGSLRAWQTSDSASNGLVSFTGLYPNEYYAIVETAAPAGYQISANAVVVRTTYSASTGVECRVVTSGGFTMGRDGGALKWYDHPVSVRIDKIVDGGYLLRGAYMQLLDSEGNVLERWMSGKINPHRVKAKLLVGETYYIREVQAPTGYLKADAISFTVESLPSGGYSSATQTQVEKMTDASDGTKTDGSEIGVNPDTGATETAAGDVKTGDTSPIGFYVLIAAAAFAAVIAVIAAGRKKKNG